MCSLPSEAGYVTAEAARARAAAPVSAADPMPEATLATAFPVRQGQGLVLTGRWRPVARAWSSGLCPMSLTRVRLAGTGPSEHQGHHIEDRALH